MSNVEFTDQGQWLGLEHRNEENVADLYAFVWVDRDRRYFITNTSNLRHGEPYTRLRVRQVQPVETQLPPERVELTIDQPIAAETYYKVCGKIDQHNRSRHDNLMLERKIHTKDWSFRVNLSIFGMIVVDACNVYRQLRARPENERTFYNKLAEELIDNQYDRVRCRTRSGATASPELIGQDGMPRAGGMSAHLTPTKRKRNKGTSRFLGQGRCCICSKKTTSVCSRCLDNEEKEVFCCHSKTGRDCFAQHCSKHDTS